MKNFNGSYDCDKIIIGFLVTKCLVDNKAKCSDVKFNMIIQLYRHQMIYATPVL